MGPASPVGQGLFIASLSFLAGMTDAIGLMSAGSFVSFMSGNTTNLGVALSALDGRHAAWLAAVLALFVLGSAMGEIVHQRAGRPRGTVLVCVGMLMLAASACVFHAWQVPAFLLVVLAMGVLNAAFERSEGQAVGLTYVTGALARVGQAYGRYAATGEKPRPLPHVAAFCGLLTGALAGAAFQHRYADAAIVLPMALAWVLAALSWRWKHVPG
jgi:uncharacterized membrane protein YoaK (UPF0700 family)